MVTQPNARLSVFLRLIFAGCLLSGVAHAQNCLPIDMPDRNRIFAAPHRVFAHYFNRLPLSLGSQDPSQDYYTQNYLKPEGEKDKWLAQGGYLRSRPLLPAVISPVPIPPGSTQSGALEQARALAGARQEVALALARGIAGFSYDILSPDDVEPGGRLDIMRAAAAAVDPRFSLMIMPDMASLGDDTDKVAAIVKAVYADDGLYRLGDGRLVIAPFMAEAVSPAAWRRMLDQLKREGFRLAFLPTFLSPKLSYIDAYGQVGDGIGVFGTPLTGAAQADIEAAQAMHAEGKLFMAGISPQGYRPKDAMFWEAQGSQAYRDGWESAIAADADLVQLTTWNDFSESTQVSPYTDGTDAPGEGYYDLTGYYASWYLTGTRPRIDRDALIYFYRRQSVEALAARAAKQTVPAPHTPAGEDKIELLAFLTRPGTLRIEIGETAVSRDVPAGVHSLDAPLRSGVPHFSLRRDGQTVIAFDGAPEITGMRATPSGYADLTYWSGVATAAGTCPARLSP